MPTTLRGARPGLRFLPPARHPWLLPFAAVGSWLYVRAGSGVRREVCLGMDKVVDAYRDMQAGRTRLIVAFRHPGVEDGPVMFRLMSGILAREARRQGVRFMRAPRGIMLYGRDVPEWGGQFLAWLLPHLGAVSVYPGRLHSESIAAIRRCLTDSPYPVVLAPEGQVTYHNDRVAALEQGTAQLAFWCVEDLKKQARTEDVVIVPVCTSYHYDPRGWPSLIRLLERLERSCGLPDIDGLTPSSGRDMRKPPSEEDRSKIFVRVMRVTRRLADLAEDCYARFYGARFAPRREEETPEDLQNRLHGICEAALSVVETRFQVTPKGDFVQRVLAVRAAGFLRQCREDVPDIESLAPVERRMADRVAQEAWLAMRHMELVDVLEYFRTDYLAADSPFDRFVETVTNLWDIANRLQGGNISGRVYPLPKTARIVVNAPIHVAARWDQYRHNRKRAVETVTAEILGSFRSVAETADRAV